jgi:3-hydroxyisobutyrate dehydrogenase-like beta-hydroxyacid dehydrogenase
MSEPRLGFIGLGVMGLPMRNNLARRSGKTVAAYDIAGTGNADSVQAVSQTSDIIFLSLPGEPQIREVVEKIAADKTVVDCSTAPVALARELAARFAHFADAPVARTRQAAVEGTLSITVGASEEVFLKVKPFLEFMATDVTHCGPPGAGQAVKLLNNMVLSVTVMALAEALAVAKASGAVDAGVLFEALAKGSADSFALRNHGMRALLPEAHPDKAFPVTYMMKDLDYALALAREAGLSLQGAGTARRLLAETAALGLGDAYHTAIVEAIRRHHEKPER